MKNGLNSYIRQSLNALTYGLSILLLIVSCATTSADSALRLVVNVSPQFVGKHANIYLDDEKILSAVLDRQVDLGMQSWNVGVGKIRIVGKEIGEFDLWFDPGHESGIETLNLKMTRFGIAVENLEDKVVCPLVKENIQCARYSEDQVDVMCACPEGASRILPKRFADDICPYGAHCYIPAQLEFVKDTNDKLVLSDPYGNDFVLEGKKGAVSSFNTLIHVDEIDNVKIFVSNETTNAMWVLKLHVRNENKYQVTLGARDTKSVKLISH